MAGSSADESAEYRSGAYFYGNRDAGAAMCVRWRSTERGSDLLVEPLARSSAVRISRACQLLTSGTGVVESCGIQFRRIFCCAGRISAQ